MMVEKRIEIITNKVLNKVRETFTPCLWERAQKIKIMPNYKMRSALGRAYYNKSLIEIHARAFKSLPNERLEQTIAHEIAHLISFLLYSDLGRGHGHYWQKTMRKLGYPPETTHKEYEAVKPFIRKMKRHMIECGECAKEYKITTKKLNKLDRYRCRCGGSLDYIGEVIA